MMLTALFTSMPLVADRLRRLLASQAGQAMVEYSTITFGFLVGSVVTFGTIPFPGKEPFLVTFFRALTQYMNSVYFWIDAPLP